MSLWHFYQDSNYPDTNPGEGRKRISLTICRRWISRTKNIKLETKMLRQILLSKLHRATVTECDINYNGSIKIDEALLEASGMREFEKVEIFDINNGARFSTYIILGERGSGEISINGAAARMVQIGDKIIIINYGMLDEAEMQSHKPTIVVLGEANSIERII